MQERQRLRLIALNGRPITAPVSTLTTRVEPKKKPPRRIRKAVADAFARQDRTTPDHRLRIRRHDNIDYRTPNTVKVTDGTVIHAMGRRQQVTSDKSYAPAQLQIPTRVKVGWLRTWRRLMVWFSALLRFQLGNLWDALNKRDSEARRAVRLRQTFEHVGGTFVKIGQQMASRLDFLPQRYCEELSLMLDRYPPFPPQKAIASIERATGKRLEEVFSEFDPEPIGSASIACV